MGCLGIAVECVVSGWAQRTWQILMIGGFFSFFPVGQLRVFGGILFQPGSTTTGWIFFGIDCKMLVHCVSGEMTVLVLVGKGLVAHR